MTKQIATIISRIFDPFIVFTILLVLTFIRGGVPSVSTLVITVFLTILVPVALIMWGIKMKMVKNWDMSERKERPKVLGILIVIYCVDLLLLHGLLGAVTFRMFIFFFAVLTGFTIITLKWKISGHTMSNAFVTGMIVTLYGPSWWPILFVVPAVAWARVVRRDHTILQVVAGAVYSWGLLLLFNNWIVR